MALDINTNVGRVRLRTGDFLALEYLPDAVYQQAIDDASGNLPQAAKVCATYILGMLSHKTRRRLNQLEVYGSEAFQQYKEFLLLTVKDPAFMSVAPIPHVSEAEFNPIIDFQNNWNAAYSSGTEAQSLARIADASPNDNSRTGWGF